MSRARVAVLISGRGSNMTALVEAAVPLPAWAADTGRAHLNSFRVDAPPFFSLSSSFDLAAAAAAAVTGSSALGSALFGLPSLANHSCAPSAAPAWGGQDAPASTLRLVALRDLAPGEAVTLSYIDDELPVRVRRSQLLDGYGFECGCARCLGEEAE